LYTDLTDQYGFLNKTQGLVNLLKKAVKDLFVRGFHGLVWIY